MKDSRVFESGWERWECAVDFGRLEGIEDASILESIGGLA